VDVIVDIVGFVLIFWLLWYDGGRFTGLLYSLKERIRRMSAALDRLTQEVAETRSVNDSLLTLLAGLSEQIRDNAGNEDALNDLADQLDAEQTRLAAAVEENSGGGEPQPEPEPSEAPVTGDAGNV
jgi:chromosome segregation ATPase